MVSSFETPPLASSPAFFFPSAMFFFGWNNPTVTYIEVGGGPKMGRFCAQGWTLVQTT
jgi:hypothetical protein